MRKQFLGEARTNKVRNIKHHLHSIACPQIHEFTHFKLLLRCVQSSLQLFLWNRKRANCFQREMMVVDRYCTEGIQASTKVANNGVRMSFNCHSISIKKANPKVGFSILINLISYCSTMNRTLLVTSSVETSNMYNPSDNSFAKFNVVCKVPSTTYRLLSIFLPNAS